MPTKTRKKESAETEANTYTVKRAFKYGARRYKQGDHFIPAGHKNDKMIIEHLCTVQLGGIK